MSACTIRIPHSDKRARRQRQKTHAVPPVHLHHRRKVRPLRVNRHLQRLQVLPLAALALQPPHKPLQQAGETPGRNARRAAVAPALTAPPETRPSPAPLPCTALACTRNTSTSLRLGSGRSLHRRPQAAAAASSPPHRRPSPYADPAPAARPTPPLSAGGSEVKIHAS